MMIYFLVCFPPDEELQRLVGSSRSILADKALWLAYAFHRRDSFANSSSLGPARYCKVGAKRRRYCYSARDLAGGIPAFRLPARNR